MKLWKTVSWLKGTLQRNLFPHLEECCERPLTEKEQQPTSILDTQNPDEQELSLRLLIFIGSLP